MQLKGIEREQTLLEMLYEKNSVIQSLSKQADEAKKEIAELKKQVRDLTTTAGCENE